MSIIGYMVAVASIIILGDFPGYDLTGMNEDDMALGWVYSAACLVGHANTCHP